MKKASNFSISRRQHIVLFVVVPAVLAFLVSHFVWSPLDKDEPAKCPQDMIAQGYTCVFPKNPAQDPCATGAAKVGCGRMDPDAPPIGDPAPRPPAPPAEKYTPPAPPHLEDGLMEA